VFEARDFALKYNFERGAQTESKGTKAKSKQLRLLSHSRFMLNY
jgi:hypothetical protein